MSAQLESRRKEIPRVLLILTTSTYKASALLAACRSLGVDVTVASERRQALHSFNPDGHLLMRTGATDDAVDAIFALAQRLPLAAVLAPDDAGSPVAAKANARLGLAGHSPEAVVDALDKLRTRRALANAGLPTPWFVKVSTAEDLATIDSFPCVIKPLRGSASWGVMRADDRVQLLSAWQRLRQMQDGSGEALVEGFLAGLEVAVEGILQNGRLHTLAIFDKPDPLDGPFFQETVLVTPSRHEAEVQVSILDAVAAASSAIGLDEGPIHAELRVDRTDHRPVVLEVAPRSIGGLCAQALSFDIDDRQASLEELIVRRALGEDISAIRLARPSSGVMMIPIEKRGRLRRVRGLGRAKAVPGVTSIIISVPVGAPIVPPPESRQYLGFIFAEGHEPSTVEGALRSAHDKLRVEVD